MCSAAWPFSVYTKQDGCRFPTPMCVLTTTYCYWDPIIPSPFQCTRKEEERVTVCREKLRENLQSWRLSARPTCTPTKTWTEYAPTRIRAALCVPITTHTYKKKKELSFYKCIARTFLQQLNGFSLELDQLMPLQDWPAIEDRPVPLSLNKVPAREELSKWIGETVYKYEHEKHAS